MSKLIIHFLAATTVAGKHACACAHTQRTRVHMDTECTACLTQAIPA